MTKPFSIFLLALCCIAFTSTDCKHTPTGPNNPTFALTVEDASCTEAWLKLSVTNITNPTVVLKRDSLVIDTLLLTTADTTIVDENLLPSHTYTYTAQLLNYSTTQVQVRTMDTTSHSFSFTTTLLSDGSSSSQFNDVAIINDTLAIAVGDFYKNDTEFNAAIWNGLEWTPKRITVNFRGNMILSSLEGVFAFSSTDIWFVATDPIHGDGQNWIDYDVRTITGDNSITVSKAWGDNSKNMYFVGRSGTIVHYNGTSWSKIESGTSLDIRDTYGAHNSKTGNWEIYATAGNPLISSDHAVLQISGNTAQSISTNGIGGGLNGLWFTPGHYYWIVGDGVWEKHPTISDVIWHSQYITGFGIDAVRGNGSNDVFMGGEYGEFLHFNGLTWKSYQFQIATGASYYGLAVRSNKIIAVGQNNGNAVITMGSRN